MRISRTVQVYRLIIWLAWFMLLASWANAGFLFYEEAPINYSDTKPKDPIAAMILPYEQGKLGLDNTSEKAFLHSLLDKIDVPLESQVLVFSHTSFQNDLIRPQRPRAIYFSENFYVGWVQGGSIEIASMDPDLGPIFYRMDTPFGRQAEPHIVRDNQCLNCHGSSRTNGYPGMIVRSVYPNSIGSPIFGAGTRRTDHSSPINERWGGWFVTGESAGQRHQGNIYYKEGAPGEAIPVMDYGGNLKTLGKAFDTSKYLAPTSDIVALMVLEHQVMAHNAIIRAHLNTKRWLYIDANVGKHTDRPEGKIGAATLSYIDRGANDLLRVLLFTDEANLEIWGVEGGEAFQKSFAGGALRDADGHSLRDLQLLSRLFKTRLSYMIYSSSFDHLHPVMKKTFYLKLWQSLHGKGEAKIIGHLGDRECTRILKILLATKKGLPAYWRK